MCHTRLSARLWQTQHTCTMHCVPHTAQCTTMTNTTHLHNALCATHGSVHDYDKHNTLAQCTVPASGVTTKCNYHHHYIELTATWSTSTQWQFQSPITLLTSVLRQHYLTQHDIPCYTIIVYMCIHTKIIGQASEQNLRLIEVACQCAGCRRTDDLGWLTDWLSKV